MTAAGSGTIKEVVIHADRVVELDMEFDKPSGARFLLRDPGGRRLFNADFLTVAPREMKFERFGSVSSEFTALDVSSGAVAAARAMVLTPGRYRYRLLKLGFALAEGEFEVTGGEIRDATIELEPENS